MTVNSSQRPVSATHPIVALVSLLAFAATVFIIRTDRPFGDNIVYSAMFVIGVTALVVGALEMIWQKVQLNRSTGMDFTKSDPSWPRTLIKFVGLVATFAFIAFLYWLFPEYRVDRFDGYFKFAKITIGSLLIVALPYIHLVDKYMVNPHDGYWMVGKLVTGDFKAVNGRVLGQHVLGWIVKGFFIPLMFTYMCGDLRRFIGFDFTTIKSFKYFFDFTFDTLYFVDVGIATIGYLMSFRLLNTHLRSTEPTMAGWAVALMCYEPFWTLAISRQYINYETNFKWGDWLWNTPTIYVIWGSFILFLTAVYVWATVSFGMRFSNLTHRGIITSGPYRLTKHPAYVSKCLSWWFISIPFMAKAGGFEAVRLCLSLLLLNGVYLMRAKTEERHLSKDPDYVAYSKWIDENGIFRWLRYVPILGFIANSKLK